MKHLLCHMIVRLWDSTRQSACQRPTSWSDMTWLRSQRTTQATYINSNRGSFQEAHVTLCPNSHTDMLSWIPDIPRAVGSSQHGASTSAYLSITPCASSEGDQPGDTKCTCHQLPRWQTSARPLCVPLSAAEFHFSKQHNCHIGDNSSPIMDLITKRLL